MRLSRLHLHRLLSAVSLFLLLCLAACRGPRTVAPETAGLSSARLEAVHALLEENVRKGSVAGAVAAVARRGEVAYLDAAGMQDREAGAPMRADTIFRICSMTKPVTSVAVMMLVEEGRVALEDPIDKFLPELKEVKVAVAGPAAAAAAPGARGGHTLVPAERPITIRHLLTHTSGLTYTFSGMQPASGLYKKAGVEDGLVETDVTNAENARRLAAQPLLFQPGTAWAYGLSTDLLGRLVEVVSGMSLEEVFRRRIFEPLGMEDTCFRPPPEKLGRLAAAYRPAAAGVERLPEGPVRLGPLVYSASYPYAGPGALQSGGAGLVSTVPDYLRFLRMLRNGGELGGVRILKVETVDQMTRDQIAPLEPNFKNHGDGFGLGFGVVTEKGKDLGLGSAGTYSWGGFFYTYFWVDPRKDLIGLVMAQLHPWDGRTLWDDFRKRVYEAVVD